jgi:hypothetical protein
MADVPVVAIFVAAIVSGFVGALLGAAFLIRALRTGRISVHTVDLPRRIVALENLTFSVAILGQQGRVVADARQTFDMNSLGATAVQAWLDDNGLIAQPKGPDFKASPLRGTSGQPRR